ncbi:MAG: MFS transporter [Betaproteobacteria bacterium]
MSSPALALGATLAIQVYASFVCTAAAVLAPAIAESLAVPPSYVGGFIGIVYLGAMVASLLSGAYIARHGAIRVSQICVVLCAIGIAGVAAAGANALVVVAIAAIVIGVGYGPITPASSDVLARTTPPSRMSLVFSIKQTGVPAGAALAGAIVAATALLAGWRTALAIVALAGIAVAIAAQSVRAALDTHRRADADLAIGRALHAVRDIFRHRELASIACLSFVYAATQVSLTSFLVVHLTGELRWSLVAAGLALSAGTTAGVVGRIAWGALSDRTRNPRLVLGVIGLVAGACAATTAASTIAWPAIAIYATVAVFGATAIGWNGVMLAEVARLSPPGEAGATTGATGFVTFAGVMAGPPLFAALSAVTSSTRWGFAAVAVLSAATGVAFLLGAGVRRGP